MPAKNSIGNFHGRHPLISIALWKKYIKETGQNIDYKEFRLIISTSTEEIKDWVLKEPIGFQLPEIGNIAINKFKPMEEYRTYIGRTPIRNYNLHTSGNMYAIRWFYSSSSLKKRIPYWFFRASRGFNRALAAVLKGDNKPNYNEFMQDHFVNKALRACKY